MSAKEDLFNYVIESPENTNPAVLKSLINAPDLKEVETIELTDEEARRILSQNGSITTVGGRNVKELMKEVREGKSIPILKLPYSRPSPDYNVCDCRFIGKDPSPDSQYETLMWTLVTRSDGIQNFGRGYYYYTMQNDVPSNYTKIYYLTYAYNASNIKLQTK